MPSGYYRYPTLYKNTVVFVSEDDLWSVPVAGGIARRLTSNLGKTSSPFLSPDGELLAYVGREEGQAEVYVMPARGGSARRLTFMGGDVCLVAGRKDYIRKQRRALVSAFYTSLHHRYPGRASRTARLRTGALDRIRSTGRRLTRPQRR
jgi:tricorn protease-like protein